MPVSMMIITLSVLMANHALAEENKGRLLLRDCFLGYQHTAFLTEMSEEGKVTRPSLIRT